MQQRNPISGSDGTGDLDGAADCGPFSVGGRGDGGGHGDGELSQDVPIGDLFDKWVDLTAELWSMRKNIARKMLQADMKIVERERARNGFFSRLAATLAKLSVERTAIRLGCHRSTVYRKIRNSRNNR